ncbi:FAD assembly factor SdhE [Beijerinckia mobilis]|uniref:FAD assembly factor SdhE n=1 Tax=Beijerinckia mobilis TaxID=231434 RepID=UPI00054D1C21|nr:succinate dehydrogenase assembly factor 2 [Beijerinckia mobilis]
MSGMQPIANLDARRRRIQFRAWHRGMREMDLLLGGFVDAQLSGLSDTELDDLEYLMEAIDRDIFTWLTGEVPLPGEYDRPIFHKILAFHTHQSPIHL